MRCLLLLSISALILYSRVAAYPFLLWDDPGHITSNPFFNPTSWEHFLHFWTNAYDGLYIPISYSLWFTLVKIESLFGYDLAHLSAAPFHLLNLVIHLANSFLVFQVIQTLLSRWTENKTIAVSKTKKNQILALTQETRNRIALAALFGSGLFLLHPVQIETFAWISGFRDVLASFFALLSLRSDLNYLRQKSTRSYFVTGLYLLLSLLSKPSTVFLPIWFGLIRYFFFNEKKKGASDRLIPDLKALIPFFLLSGVIGVVTKVLQPDETITEVSKLWQRPWIASDALVFYFHKLVAPFSLSADYGRSVAFASNQTLFWIAPPLVLVFLTLLYRLRLKHALFLIGTLFFISGLLPVLGILPFDYQNYSTVADRFNYLPVFGFSLLFSALILEFGSKTRSFALIFLAMMATLGFQRLWVWSSDSALYLDILKTNPVSFMAHNNLGLKYLNEEKLPEALSEFHESLRIRSDHLATQVNYGALLARLGRYDELIQHDQEMIKQWPNSANLYSNLGAAQILTGRIEEGLKNTEKATQLDPHLINAFQNLAKTLLEHGRVDEAASILERGLQANPGNAVLMDLLVQAKASHS